MYGFYIYSLGLEYIISFEYVPVSNGFVSGVPLANGGPANGTKKATSFVDNKPNDSPTNYYLGNLVVATAQCMDSLVGSVIGEIWIEYEVALLNPHL